MGDIYQIPPGMIVDPFLDMVAVLPIWMWILLGLFVALLLSCVYWLMRYFVMRPVMGAASSANSGSATKKQVFFFEKTRSFRIATMECIDDILSYADLKKIPKWLITSPLAVGKVNFNPILICSNSYDSTRDPVAELAILKICNEFNAGEPERAITNFDDFQDVAPSLKALFPDGIDVPSYCLYRPEAIQEYTPQSRSAALFGGMCIRDAKKLNLSAPPDSGLSRFIPLILFAGVAIVSIAITFLYVSGKTAVT